MEDFDENPLYRAFLTKFQREFEIACRMSCIIAIPTSESLNEVLIDQFLANSHILMPSKLLKMHYTPLQVGHCDDIEIDGRKMIVYLSRKKPINKFTVNILAEEIGYNASNKEFRTVLIDRPLLANKSRRFISYILPIKSPNQTKFTKTKPTKQLTSHDDCSKYLESFSQKLTADLKTEVKCLQSNYIILSQYLDDAAKRIKGLVEDFIPKYEQILVGVGGNENMLCDSVRHAIKLAVENYVIHSLHGKLMASIHNQYEKEDKLLLDRFCKLRDSRLTICQLGAQSAFAEFNLSEELISELMRLPYQQSPLALVTSLIKLVKLISEGLNQSVKFKHLMGDGNSSSGDKVIICSDDLIASFVYSLAQAKPNSLYSISKYLETFSWSSNFKDQAAYYTATFQIVIQYILNFLPDEVSTSNGSLGTKTQDDINQRPTTTNRFLESLDSRICSSSDQNSSLSSVSSSLKAEWEVI